MLPFYVAAGMALLGGAYGDGMPVLHKVGNVDVDPGSNKNVYVVDGEIMIGAQGGVPVETRKVTVNSKNKTYTGYVPKAELDALNVSSVSIPANFAGLEAVDVPTRLTDQYFDIYEVNENEDYVEVRARHIFYRNIKNNTLWKPDKETSYTGAAACRNILSNAISPVTFKVASDCTDTLKGSELDYERKNIVECFLDPENGICKKYGLNLIRDNDAFYCLKEVGFDRGFVVESGKNLLGVDRTENIENIVTRCAPYGKDNKGEIVWLNNNGTKYVDSTHINDYASPYVELFDTGLKIGENGVTQQNIQQKLLEAGQKRFSEDKVDIPEIEMKIEFLSLGDTEEYAQYRGLDKVYLYDIITVNDVARGYSYTAQVVGVEHDILTGMLLSVTIGKLNNWDGTRKIATWQVPEVDGRNIRLLSIMAGAYAPQSISGVEIQNRTLRAGHLEMHSITADVIDTTSLAAAFIEAGELHAAVATITDAEIENADIGFAQIKDLTAENLIAHDAVTDRYYIRKLAVDNAQMVHATVNDLVIGTADGKYYKLVIGSDGSITPTEVTLTIGEITAGVTEDGRSSIIETDLTVTDLSAANMKAINALIDKLTASRIDVDELFAREATIDRMNANVIMGDRFLSLAINTGSNLYTQRTDPALTPGNTVKDGDRWQKTSPEGSTWDELTNYTINELATRTLDSFEQSTMYFRSNGEWIFWTDDLDLQQITTQIVMTTDQIRSIVGNAMQKTTFYQTPADIVLAAEAYTDNGLSGKYTIVSGIAITANGIEVSGSKYVKIKSGGTFEVDSGNFSISATGAVTMSGTVTAGAGSTIGGWSLGANRISSGSGTGYVAMDSATNGTYAIWAGNSTASSAPFRVKRDGTVTLTKLMALGEDGTESEVNLRAAGLWKLNYRTVKSFTKAESGGTVTLTLGTSGGDLSVNFNTAASVVLTGSWSGRTEFTVVANNQSIIPIVETFSFQQGAGKGDGNDITITSYNPANNMGHADISSTRGGRFIVNADASGVYTAGESAGYSRGYTSGRVDGIASVTVYSVGQNGSATYSASNKSYNIPIIGTASNSATKTDSITLAANAAYNAGWNDCLDACDFASGGFWKYANNTYLYPAPMTPTGQGQNYWVASGWTTAPARK